MALKEIPQNTVIYERGQKITNLYLIMRGSVRASYEGGNFVLHNGDVIGLVELNNEETYLKYEALEKISVLPFPYQTGGLQKLFENSGESMRYFMSSLFRQLNELLSQYKLLKVESTCLCNYITSCYEEYSSLCSNNNISPSELEGYTELSQMQVDGDVPSWMAGYYGTMEQMVAVWDYNKTDVDFIVGILMKSSWDMSDITRLCQEMIDYKVNSCQLLMNQNSLDMFDLYLTLYSKLVKKNGMEHKDAVTVQKTLNEILMQLETRDYGKYDFYKKRKQNYEGQLTLLYSQCQETEAEESKYDQNAVNELKDSLNTILAYAGCEEELTSSFRKHVEEYKKTVNKNGTEDEIRTLRLRITKEFNEIYIHAFQNSVKDIAVPRILQMFFNFGYVDEELAGMSNAVFMYQNVDKLPTAPDQGIYTYYEWLMAIYDGRKDPGRNEFDMDYGEHLHEQMRTGKITKEEEMLLLKDAKGRVMYELENVFPAVNKMTFGRITTFCPLFSEHNMLKPIDSILVSEEQIHKTINAIRRIDYGAYYRETIYSNPDEGITKEFINIEILPDFILTPNAGTRGVMWQEIEGKRRSTPARMMLSIFQLDDINMQLIRLTGQFRWEMCKRIQGGRWNDISERSLTSEYFDYVQFYRKNNDLSAEAKDKIKTEMTRAKNSFKEMFVRDYCIWVLFESNGSPRLNKVARSILFTYCTFSKDIREKLGVNPMYTELMTRYDIKMAQKRHRMDNLIQKLHNLGKRIPEEIQKEQEFLNM